MSNREYIEGRKGDRVNIEKCGIAERGKESDGKRDGKRNKGGREMEEQD